VKEKVLKRYRDSATKVFLKVIEGLWVDLQNVLVGQFRARHVTYYHHLIYHGLQFVQFKEATTGRVGA